MLEKAALWSSLIALLAVVPLYARGGGAPEFIMDIEAGEEIPEDTAPGPWFTGPLLTPSGHVVPVGFINFEPYLFVNTITGTYDNDWHARSLPDFHTVTTQFPVFIGLTKWMDILVAPETSYNSTQGASSVQFGDLNITLDFQLVADTMENKLPGIKLFVKESFPTGKYEKLDPDLLGTDIGGNGSFVTTAGIVITRLFHLSGLHYLATRFNFFYAIPSYVDVTGFNAYGGAKDTRATIKLGHRFGALLGLEYSLTQNWVLAVDLFGSYNYKTRFSGNPGTDPITGIELDLSGPTAIQFSIAPAIEYNFNAAWGIIAGAWLPFAGKNTSDFINAVVALNYYGPLPSVKHKYRSRGGGASL